MPGLVEPKKVQVTPVYVCGKCDSSHYESIDYVNKVGKILCYCGEVLELKPIANFKVKPVYVKVEKIKNKSEFIDIENSTDDVDESNNDECEINPDEMLPQKTEDTPFSSEEFFDRSIDFLMALGYKKREACSIVEKRSKSFENTPVNEDNFEEFAKSLLFSS
tara:strand:+ start:1833 stop:2321 length:489 start_codon:yes stop_codon:yes gene_type:complete